MHVYWAKNKPSKMRLSFLCSILPSSTLILVAQTVRDWQGNIRAVVRKGADGKTILEQATYYYPYGMPMAESTNPTANRYKYTGKELLTDHGVNIMDYGARFYDPTTGLWLSPDPHSADYAPMSHYAMCAGDPINFVDPDGKDFFLFDQKGNLLNRTEIAEYDIVAMKIGADEFEFGPMMEPNTMSMRETIPTNDFETNESIKVDIIDVKGDTNVKDVHQFLSDKGNVEFTRFDTGDTAGDNASNIITTSHQTNTDNGSWHAANQLNHAHVNVRTMVHNHPSGSGPSNADILNKEDWSSNSKSFSKTTFGIYIKSQNGNTPGKYHNYTNDKLK